MRPLVGIEVVDFSTLLPGPLASLILAEAGALVINVERPGDGNELRRHEPRLGAGAPGVAHPIPHLLCSTGPSGQDQSPPSPQAPQRGPHP
jgi:crotonobetainyl-CoA:carnitine CoA-transferase CaiB-like acyl-CoA transferase